MAGSWFPDTTPLRISPDYRRLWVGNTVAYLGVTTTTVTVAYQMYQLTGSSFAVGAIGLVAILPFIIGGLYGGALVDHFDRKRVALITAGATWLGALALVSQAMLSLNSQLCLYLIVGVQSVFVAVNGPARNAIIPRLLPRHALAAANALSVSATALALALGPLVAGVILTWQGVAAAYLVDALAYTALLYALVRLPPMPVVYGENKGTAPGFASVLNGFRFLRQAPNLRASFLVDMCAMVFAEPQALFPALALGVYAGNPSALGLLQAAPSIGALIGFTVSGPLHRIRRQGLAIVLAVAGYGTAITFAGVAAIGAPGLLVLGVVMLSIAGGFDMVSATFRFTMLQAAVPDDLRGRIQGLFTVVVVGGPRLGQFLIGSAAMWLGEPVAMVVGGVACAVAVGVTTAFNRGRLLRYDARDPSP
ncbi:MFS transporter [Mycobacterium sp. NAZ190054]|uniref:MFS transporter n=1 Tax=Mycobacterium sp. NAZ190054 TaxID=1747766 RepID=UPI000793CC5D|nr:MFS transporter [Mycobacterium sp. NAZ190054]KWX57586.1 hypothetical protein ASJ79_11195 [Mycobacterium sp. NAZ190054]